MTQLNVFFQDVEVLCFLLIISKLWIVMTALQCVVGVLFSCFLQDFFSVSFLLDQLLVTRLRIMLHPRIFFAIILWQHILMKLFELDSNKRDILSTEISYYLDNVDHQCHQSKSDAKFSLLKRSSFFLVISQCRVYKAR